MDAQVKRFVSGERLGDAVSRAKKLNKQGINSIISHLSENVKIKKQATENAFLYLEIIDQISKNKLSSSICLKPSQIGLLIEQPFCGSNIQKILKVASKNNVFVWIDTEDQKHAKKSLNIFKNFSKSYENMGIVIHASMLGTGEILEGLIKQNARIAITKGIEERTENTFKTDFQINLNYLKLMNTLFEKSDKFAISTTDFKMIKHADNLQHRYKRSFEFQFLMGVRPKLEINLVRSGYIVSEHVPFGHDWKDYYEKRIREQNLHILE